MSAKTTNLVACALCREPCERETPLEPQTICLSCLGAGEPAAGLELATPRRRGGAYKRTTATTPSTLPTIATR